MPNVPGRAIEATARKDYELVLMSYPSPGSPDVEDNPSGADAHRVKLFEQSRREMQPGRWRRDRAALARVHGLIPRAIFLGAAPRRLDSMTRTRDARS